ncbi:MAG: beta-ketoacyl-ACP synthase II [Pseudomonadota bacterium]|nr:beta-ketoacyl-ACP synthase II [Pseudomonadota bacterium]MEC9458629.1 beta-ketoacyl-ACP synthase II [Pseudomonadota bacterium]
MRRVVVTGIGAVTPLGGDINSSWKNLIDGKSSATLISKFDIEDFQAKVACEVPIDQENHKVKDRFNPNDWFSGKDLRKIDNFIIFGVAAAEMAILDSGINNYNFNKNNVGVGVGSGVGGLPSIEKASITLKEKGPKRVSPFFIPGALINLVAGQISIRNELKGPNLASVTACSSGTHSIIEGAETIKRNKADVMIVGGAESAICPVGIAGFAACKALSTNFNDSPEKASRPYDSQRDGFVMGEGAGFIVLEELNHALERGAKIYSEFKGYGVSGDAHHITSPAEDGDGAYRSMIMAIKDSNLAVDEFSYINAHGTSTPKGDEIELKAVEKAFSSNIENITMSSTKSSIGHLLGAAGAVEAIFSILAIKNNVIPATINLDDLSIDTKINLVPHNSISKNVEVVLSNSFGFGGTNASVVFSSYKENNGS